MTLVFKMCSIVKGRYNELQICSSALLLNIGPDNKLHVKPLNCWMSVVINIYYCLLERFVGEISD